MSDADQSLWELLQFSDNDERHQFMAGIIGLTLTWQIRGMREARGWSQEDLAARMETAQSQISRLESPKGVLRTSLKTLIKLAHIFDVALVARFSDWKTWMERILGEAAFAPPPHSQDQLNALTADKQEEGK